MPMNYVMMTHVPRRAQQGVSLIEVLVVFFVLSVGLLGMAALQMKSMQYNQSSYVRSQANVAAYDILDRMRLNRAVALAAGYDVGLGTAVAAGTLAQTDLNQWKAFLASSLPAGDGAVACVAATSTCTITLRWTDRINNSPMTMTIAAQI